MGRLEKRLTTFRRHCYFFFFSSRRRHTRSDRDWSSDVCSSDLYDQQKAVVAQLQASIKADEAQIETARLNLGFADIRAPIDGRLGMRLVDSGNRSEERRVGKECRSRWSPYH